MVLVLLRRVMTIGVEAGSCWMRLAGWIQTVLGVKQLLLFLDLLLGNVIVVQVALGPGRRRGGRELRAPLF